MPGDSNAHGEEEDRGGTRGRASPDPHSGALEDAATAPLSPKPSRVGGGADGRGGLSENGGGADRKLRPGTAAASVTVAGHPRKPVGVLKTSKGPADKRRDIIKRVQVRRARSMLMFAVRLDGCQQE